MAKEIPMPLEVAFSTKITNGMNAIAYGAYASLVHSFWMYQTEIPQEETELMRLARCTPKRWCQCRDKVKKAFFAVIPDIAEKYAERLAARNARADTAAHMRSVRKSRSKKNPANGRFIPLSDTQRETLPATPQEAVPFKGDGTSDHATRQQVIAHETLQRSKNPEKKSLTDKAKGS